MTDDRQTDHAMEKWVAIGEIACAGAIAPNNNNKQICIASLGREFRGAGGRSMSVSFVC